MSTDATTEKRLTALEAAVAALQQRLSKGTRTQHWLERFTGAFKDEPAFDEVVEYGRQFRAADRPQENPSP